VNLVISSKILVTNYSLFTRLNSLIHNYDQGVLDNF